MSTSEALQQLGRLIQEKATVERLARALHDPAVDLRLIPGELAFIAICSDNANALALLVEKLHISGVESVRERYVEGVEAMCDSDVADDLSRFGTDAAQGGAVCRAYREATQGLSDASAGRKVHRRLKRMLRAMERLLRVMGLYDVDTAEEWAEFVAIKSAVNAAQPGVVEWLLDVWGVDFEAAQLRDPVYSLSDYARACIIHPSCLVLAAGRLWIS
eukprot:jgi/Tetstr1/424715/TSEL_015233.t1